MADFYSLIVNSIATKLLESELPASDCGCGMAGCVLKTEMRPHPTYQCLIELSARGGGVATGKLVTRWVKASQVFTTDAQKHS